ncbi:MAG: DUF5031 domain-containing protein [Bacteroidales bacterium]|jgi:hypothetical protein|nr:DUF5031 domain-containing protein [Bacteroidales bacterium]
MKNQVILQVVSFCIGMALLSCSDALDTDDNMKHISETHTPVSINIKRNAVTELKYDIYIFRKALDKNEPYLLTDSAKLEDLNSESLRFKNITLVDSTFRFLFLSTDKNTPQIFFKNKNGSIMQFGDEWDDIMIVSTDSISGENYYGIVECSGDQILNGRTIQADMQHIGGRIVLDIFRTETTVREPVSIVSPKVASVLDRVFKIKMEYTGRSQSVYFNDLSMIDDVAGNERATYTQFLYPDTVLNTLKVNLPQSDRGIENAYSGVRGSARIMGIWSLQSTRKMKIKSTFYFHDTTPKCGNPDHNHASTCYSVDSLIMNIPPTSSTDLISVLPNYYTVNKAGIRFDRIIDLKHTSSIEFIWDWNKN